MKSKIPSKKSCPYIYIYIHDVKFLALLGVPYIYIYIYMTLAGDGLIDTYNPDVVTGTESWLTEEISNAEVFRADYTTFRIERHAHDGGVFICAKNYITCAEIWVDEKLKIEQCAPQEICQTNMQNSLHQDMCDCKPGLHTGTCVLIP
jgi:hypothetical protein